MEFTKFLIVSICILGMVGIAIGITVLAGDQGTITCSVTAKGVSIYRGTDGNVEYGSVSLSSSTSTEPAGLDDGQTFGNNGSADEKFNIKSADATGGAGWTLTADSPGDSTFRHSFSTTTTPTWQILNIAGDYETVSSTVNVDATTTVYLKIEMPTISDYIAKSIAVVVQAVGI